MRENRMLASIGLAGAAMASVAAAAQSAVDPFEQLRVALRSIKDAPRSPSASERFYFGRSSRNHGRRYARAGSGKRVPAWFKGSKFAKRATRRGGNPAKAGHI